MSLEGGEGRWQLGFSQKKSGTFTQKFSVPIFYAKQFLLPYISWGPNNITVSSNKNTFKRLPVCLR